MNNFNFIIRYSVINADIVEPQQLNKLSHHRNLRQQLKKRSKKIAEKMKYFVFGCSVSP